MSTATIMPTYARLPVSFTKGDGVWLFDENGDKYLDALAGLGVVALGHSHPEVTKVISHQAGELMHTSNLYGINNQQKLADKLVEISGLENCFFANSGAEANEAAIKIARLHAREKNIADPAIIVFDNAFHGRTLATLSATASRKVRAGFEPLVQGFIRSPLNDIDAIKNIGANNNQVVAVLVEPIQGEGGIQVADGDFLAQLRELCDQNDWLLMLDEVQSGNGRTGKYFAYQNHNFKPDVLTTAKGLGNGFPIGVCIAGKKASALLKAGNHGSTFGGNHLSCAVGLSVANIISEQSFLKQVINISAYLTNKLKTELDSTKVKTIRGSGLMIGIELNQACAELVPAALEEKLLINVTAENVIRLLPPLVLKEAEADIIVATLSKIIKQLP